MKIPYIVRLPLLPGFMVLNCTLFWVVPSKILANRLRGVRDGRLTPNARLKRIVLHECIHTAQAKELFILPFYLWYLFEWLYRLVTLKFNAHKAYYAVSFEKEAFMNEENLDYLAHRPKFNSFKKYLR